MTEPLDELTEISSQVDAAVLFDETGKVISSTLPDDRAERLAASARALFEEAGRAGEGGSLFVVREGKNLIAASTSAEPTAGLVFYDLKSTLRSMAKPKPKPRRRAPAKKNAKP